MTKQESMVMKGVAILFMLFLHLFNQMSNVGLCETTPIRTTSLFDKLIGFRMSLVQANSMNCSSSLSNGGKYLS